MLLLFLSCYNLLMPFPPKAQDLRRKGNRMKKDCKQRSIMLRVLALSIAIALFISLLSSVLNISFLKDVASKDMIKSNRTTSEISLNNIDKQFRAILDASNIIIQNSPKLDWILAATERKRGNWQ